MRGRTVLAALAVTAGCGDRRSDAPAYTPLLLPQVADLAARPATVSVSGMVFDREARNPVAEVEVVLRGEHGDITARTRADGTFALAVVPGDYRAFVRDARVLSVGTRGRERLRSGARAELAGAEDEQLIPIVTIDSDITGLELAVTAGALINGIVHDPDGEPIENVVLHAVPIESISTGTLPTVGPPIARRQAARPVLGTDTVISDASGRFVLRVPAGRYEVIADHASYAGVGGIAELELDAGTRHDMIVTLARGCIISGRVVGIGGAPPHDGALEARADFRSFGPSNRVLPDGTFRWTTTERQSVTLRAWPWKSPPSPSRTFDCHSGARYADVVLRVGNSPPDLAGTIVDANGDPVPLAYLDIIPLDRGNSGQQERADAAGNWHVYDLPAGRYQIAAHVPGRGVVTTMVVAPRSDVTLQLGGTGRISGTISEPVDGAFELTLDHCGPDGELDESARLVAVRGGRFSIDRVPACTLNFTARWRDHVVTDRVVVEPERTAYVELALGRSRDKTVVGIVRDASGKAVRGARVTAVVDDHEATTVRTDDSGWFTLHTQSGAQLVAGDGKHVGRANVGRANVAREQVDLVLDNVLDY
jgi:hypothetical protein